MLLALALSLALLLFPLQVSFVLGCAADHKVDRDVVEIGVAAGHIHYLLLRKNIIIRIEVIDLRMINDINRVDSVSGIAWDDIKRNFLCIFIGVSLE